MSLVADEPEEAPAPRLTRALYGHADAEAALLTAYRGGRVPHALLLVGPKGIGKATLAYRFARFVLAHPNAAAPEVQAATSLAVDPEHPVARRLRITPTPRHTHAHIGSLVEAMVDVWRTLGIPFVEPPAHLHLDEKSAERCTYPEIKLAAQ